MPELPLIWSEFNATYLTRTDITDSPFMGPWLADTIRQCDGLVDMMSYWTFSDVFEEQGVVEQPFHGGYGLMAVRGIPKPAYVAFELLHRLGNRRIDLTSNSALLTRGEDGGFVLVLWNYAPPSESGPSKQFLLRWKNVQLHEARIYRVDPGHSNVLTIYENLGRPRYPTHAEIDKMRQGAKLQPPEVKQLGADGLSVAVPSHGLMLIELK